MKTYIFFYFMNRKGESIRVQAPAHAKFWSNNLINGGPFSDYSGGFVIFRAESETMAQQLVDQDPFVIHSLISKSWLKEWIAKS